MVSVREGTRWTKSTNAQLKIQAFRIGKHNDSEQEVLSRNQDTSESQARFSRRQI